jgi:hypothetical protein
MPSLSGKQTAMQDNIPPRPPNSFRIVLDLSSRQKRIDTVLLQALRDQDENMALKHITRTAFKKLFDDKKIQIKGQNTRPSSALAKGITYIDILGF